MELSGYDAGIVLADVSARGVAEAIAWTGYVNCGQACVATKRLYVVGQDPEPWVAALAAAARRLRIGDPDRDEIDLGPMIRESARARFLSQIQGACGAGAVCVAGGVAADGAGWFVEPTVLHARSAEAERALEGVFGPVILVRGVATLDEAIGAANASSFGLAGSIWTRDKRKAMAVASRLQVGMVTINDGVLPSAHARSPFGGMKASGFGRVHGPEGLHEVTQPQVVFKRGLGGLRPQVYPYTGMSRSLVEIYLRLFHGVVGSRKR
jgi:acyl-CoA reductase-like NAD-dependent aldehyde dehydrogenase